MRHSGVCAAMLLSLLLFLTAAPAFATHPLGEDPPRQGGNAMLEEWPWIGDPPRQGGNNLVEEDPWLFDPPRHGANLLDESPWCDDPPRHGANSHVEALILGYSPLL